MQLVKRLLRKNEAPLEQLLNRLSERRYVSSSLNQSSKGTVPSQPHNNGPLLPECTGPEFKLVRTADYTFGVALGDNCCMFIIVNFIEAEQVEVVPGAWVKGTRCRWPRVGTDKAKKLILKRASPQSSWDSYDVQVIGVFATYEEARDKLERAQYTSDVNSDTPNEGVKRKRFPPSRFIEETDEPLSEISSTQHTLTFIVASAGTAKHSRPLPLSESEPEDDKDSEDDAPPIPENFPTCPIFEHKSGGGHTSSQGSSRAQLSQGSNSSSLYEASSVASREILGGDSRESGHQPKHALATAEFQRQVLKLLQQIRLTQQGDSDLLRELCSQRTASTSSKPLQVLIEKPFTSSEELELFEAELDEAKKSILVQELGAIGGNDIGQAVRNILAYLLTNEAAGDYSWLGRK
ncbi:uncharacterized protein LOC135384623, partial [Ornithodoros turicata]|uniref:uncharacterized protein LOC135384623 n=1 Tax=Ornithodoros turicata TaxID=34597 RepID=UPI0031387D26